MAVRPGRDETIAWIHPSFPFILTTIVQLEGVGWAQTNTWNSHFSLHSSTKDLLWASTTLWSCNDFTTSVCRQGYDYMLEFVHLLFLDAETSEGRKEVKKKELQWKS